MLRCSMLFFTSGSCRRFYWNLNSQSQLRKSRFQNLSMQERFHDFKLLSAALPKVEAVFSGIRRNLAQQFSVNEPFFDPVVIAKKLSSIFLKHKMECVIGGSFALMSHMPARMTKDLDANIYPTDSFSKEKLIAICDLEKDNGVEFKSFSKNTVPRKHTRNDVVMTCATILIDGAPVDLFFNKGWPVFDHLFRNAITIEPGLKVAPVECIVVFKMMVLAKGSKRFYKDMADITAVLEGNPRNFPYGFVREILMHHHDVDSFPVLTWDQLCKEYAT